MHTDSKTSAQDAASFQKPLLILLCVTAILDIFTLSRSALISKDGITFIHYAQSLDNQFFETIRDEYQHPGYPFLIRGVHAVVGLWTPHQPLKGWILSAQTASMICHWICIVCFYIVARNLTTRQKAFYCALVFLFLPYPASLAIDALSDWPHLMFLMASLVFLIRGMKKGGPWDYSAAGLLSGLGYLVRPESIQIAIYACGWLAMIVFLKKEKIFRAIFFLVCFLVMFSVSAIPYMAYKKSFFPKKSILSPPTAHSVGSISPGLLSASILPENRTMNGAFRLLQRISETLFYYFFPFALLGIWSHLKKGNFRCWEWYLIFLIITVNAALLYLLYSNYGYISKRHTLVISSFLIIFIPCGLELAAGFFVRNRGSCSDMSSHFHFNLLLLAGICVCLPKLLKPLGYDKAYYITIADDLKKQTRVEDAVAVPDSRIGFYSERQYYDYSHRNKDYPTEAWVELLPNQHYAIHAGPYRSNNVNTSAK